MRIANHDGRAVLVLDGAVADVATVSDGRFGPDPMGVYEDGDAFTETRDQGDGGHRTARRRPLPDA